MNTRKRHATKKKNGGARRTHTLTIRLSTDEKDRIFALARKRHINLSSLVREMLADLVRVIEENERRGGADG